MRVVENFRGAVAALIVGLVVSLFPPTARSAYPERPITLIVAYPPGGGADSLGRIIATHLSVVLQKPVTVANRTGAGGTVGAAFVAGSPPDGYTILFTESSLLVSPHLYSGTGFDPLTSFSPVASLGSLPFAIVSNPQLPAKTFPELIVLLRDNPGKYSYASGGVGTIGHLSAELLQQLASVKLVHVPYQGSGKMVADLLSGEVPLAFATVSAVMPLVKAGRVNLLAVTSPARVPYAEGTPTASESLPGLQSATNFFVLAPARLPVEIRDILSKALIRVLGVKEVADAFTAQGATVTPGSAEELSSQMAAEVARWGRLVKDIGIKPQ